MYRRREIAIDLTALLDVILIILFMFVVRSTNQTQEVSTKDITDKTTVVEKQITELKEENSELKKRVNTNTILDDTCMTLTITVDSLDDNNKRELSIVSNYKDMDMKVKYDWEDMTYAKNKLRDSLKNSLNKVKDTNQMNLIIFQYDKTKIYNKDYKLVDTIIKEIKEGNSNVYLAYYDTSDKKIIDKENTYGK